MATRLGPSFIELHGAELQKFVYEALQRIYDKEDFVGAPGEDTAEASHIIVTIDDWSCEDDCLTGEPFNGTTTVRYKGVICWRMIYWGKVLPNAISRSEQIYALLLDAFRKAPKNAPYRGPSFATDGEMVYANIWHGDIAKFHGQEKIMSSEEEWLFECDYRGGLVNVF